MSHFHGLCRVDPPPGVDANQAAISLMVCSKILFFSILFKAMAETFRLTCRYKMAIKCCMVKF